MFEESHERYTPGVKVGYGYMGKNYLATKLGGIIDLDRKSSRTVDFVLENVKLKLINSQSTIVIQITNNNPNPKVYLTNCYYSKYLLKFFLSF